MFEKLLWRAQIPKPADASPDPVLCACEYTQKLPVPAPLGMYTHASTVTLPVPMASAAMLSVEVRYDDPGRSRLAPPNLLRAVLIVPDPVRVHDRPFWLVKVVELLGPLKGISSATSSQYGSPPPPPPPKRNGLMMNPRWRCLKAPRMLVLR